MGLIVADRVFPEVEGLLERREHVGAGGEPRLSRPDLPVRGRAQEERGGCRYEARRGEGAEEEEELKHTNTDTS